MDRQIVSMMLQFLRRTQLTGQEAGAYMVCENTLKGILEGPSLEDRLAALNSAPDAPPE